MNAKELEIDGVAQNGKLVIYAMSENMSKNAGVHSGMHSSLSCAAAVPGNRPSC